MATGDAILLDGFLLLDDAGNLKLTNSTNDSGCCCTTTVPCEIDCLSVEWPSYLCGCTPDAITVELSGWIGRTCFSIVGSSGLGQYTLVGDFDGVYCVPLVDNPFAPDGGAHAYFLNTGISIQGLHYRVDDPACDAPAGGHTLSESWSGELAIWFDGTNMQVFLDPLTLVHVGIVNSGPPAGAATFSTSGAETLTNCNTWKSGGTVTRSGGGAAPATGGEYIDFYGDIAVTFCCDEGIMASEFPAGNSTAKRPGCKTCGERRGTLR